MGQNAVLLPALVLHSNENSMQEIHIWYTSNMSNYATKQIFFINNMKRANYFIDLLFLVQDGNLFEVLSVLMVLLLQQCYVPLTMLLSYIQQLF